MLDLTRSGFPQVYPLRAATLASHFLVSALAAMNLNAFMNTFSTARDSRFELLENRRAGAYLAVLTEVPDGRVRPTGDSCPS